MQNLALNSDLLQCIGNQFLSYLHVACVPFCCVVKHFVWECWFSLCGCWLGNLWFIDFLCFYSILTTELNFLSCLPRFFKFSQEFPYIISYFSFFKNLSVFKDLSEPQQGQCDLGQWLGSLSFSLRSLLLQPHGVHISTYSPYTDLSNTFVKHNNMAGFIFVRLGGKFSSVRDYYTTFRQHLLDFQCGLYLSWSFANSFVL